MLVGVFSYGLIELVDVYWGGGCCFIKWRLVRLRSFIETGIRVGLSFIFMIQVIGVKAGLGWDGVVGGLRLDLGVGFLENGFSILSSKKIRWKIEKTASEILFLSLVKDKDLWVNLSPTEDLFKLASSPFLFSQLGYDLLKADLKLKLDVEKFFKFYGVSFGPLSEATGLFRFWVVPEKVILKQEDAKAVVDRVRLSVKYEMKEGSGQLAELLKIIADKLTEKVNYSPDYSRVREIVKEVALSRWLSGYLREKLRKELLLETQLQEYVFSWWSKPSLFKSYLDNLVEIEDIVVGGFDLSNISDVLEIIEGHIPDSVKHQVILKPEELKSVLGGFIEKWFTDDPLRSPLRKQYLSGLIEAYLLRIWFSFALSMDRKNWNYWLERIIKISKDQLYQFLISHNYSKQTAKKIAKDFLGLSKQYIQLAKFKRDHFVINLGERQISLYVHNNVVVDIRGSKSLDVFTGFLTGRKSFINSKGKIVLNDTTSISQLAHYLLGHIPNMMLKKYRPILWEKIVKKFREEDIDKLLKLFIQLRYGEKVEDPYRFLRFKVKDKKFELWVTEDGTILWHRLVDEIIAMWQEIRFSGKPALLTRPEQEFSAFVEGVLSRIPNAAEIYRFKQGDRDLQSLPVEYLFYDVFGVGQFLCIANRIRGLINNSLALMEKGTDKVFELMDLLESAEVYLEKEAIALMYENSSDSEKAFVEKLLKDIPKDKVLVADLKKAMISNEEYRLYMDSIIANTPLLEDVPRRSALMLERYLFLSMVKDSLEIKLFLLRKIFEKADSKGADLSSRLGNIKNMNNQLKEAKDQQEILQMERKIDLALLPDPNATVVISALESAIEGVKDRPLSGDDFFSTVAVRLERAVDNKATRELSVLSKEDIREIISQLKGLASAKRFARCWEFLSSLEKKKQTQSKTIQSEDFLTEMMLKISKPEVKKKAIKIGIFVAGVFLAKFFGGEVLLSLFPFMPLLVSQGNIVPKDFIEPVEDLPEKSELIWNDELETVFSSISQELLKKKGKSMVVLLGRPGTGKTTVLREFARRVIYNQNVLGQKKIKLYKINTSLIGENSLFTDAFVNQILDLLKKAKKSSTQLVFLADEVHNLVPVLERLKEFMEGSGERFLIFGVSTQKEWKSAVKDDSALEQRAVVRNFPEADKPTLLRLLRKEAKKLEKQTGIKIDESAIVSIVEKSALVYSNIGEPRRSLDLLISLFSRVEERKENLVFDILATLHSLVEDLYDIRGIKLFSLKKAFAERLKKTKDRLSQLIKDWKRFNSSDYKITKEDVIDKLKERGVPDVLLSDDKQQKLKWLKELEVYLRSQVKGQDEAITQIVETLKINLLNKRRKGALGVFFFAGPSGVGKTELARALAEFISSKKGFKKIDCGNLIAKTQLTDSPKGFVGHSEGQTIVDEIEELMSVSAVPVVLFDEIEKAGFGGEELSQASDIIKTVVLPTEDGILQDARGGQVSLHNTIIIFTSNLGTEPGIFDLPKEQIKKHFLSVLERELPPEVRSRLGKNLLVFSPLTEDVVKRTIKEKFIPQIEDVLKDEGIKFRIHNESELLEQLLRFYKNSSTEEGMRIILPYIEAIKARLSQMYSSTGEKVVDVEIRFLPEKFNSSGEGGLKDSLVDSLEIKELAVEPIEGLSLDLGDDLIGRLIKELLYTDKDWSKEDAYQVFVSVINREIFPSPVITYNYEEKMDLADIEKLNLGELGETLLPLIRAIYIDFLLWKKQEPLISNLIVVDHDRAEKKYRRYRDKVSGETIFFGKEKEKVFFVLPKFLPSWDRLIRLLVDSKVELSGDNRLAVSVMTFTRWVQRKFVDLSVDDKGRLVIAIDKALLENTGDIHSAVNKQDHQIVEVEKNIEDKEIISGAGTTITATDKSSLEDLGRMFFLLAINRKNSEEWFLAVDRIMRNMEEKQCVEEFVKKVILGKDLSLISISDISAEAYQLFDRLRNENVIVREQDFLFYRRAFQEELVQEAFWNWLFWRLDNDHRSLPIIEISVIADTPNLLSKTIHDDKVVDLYLNQRVSSVDFVKEQLEKEIKEFLQKRSQDTLEVAGKLAMAKQLKQAGVDWEVVNKRYSEYKAMIKAMNPYRPLRVLKLAYGWPSSQIYRVLSLRLRKNYADFVAYMLAMVFWTFGFLCFLTMGTAFLDGGGKFSPENLLTAGGLIVSLYLLVLIGLFSAAGTWKTRKYLSFFPSTISSSFLGFDLPDLAKAIRLYFPDDAEVKMAFSRLLDAFFRYKIRFLRKDVSLLMDYLWFYSQGYGSNSTFAMLMGLVEKDFVNREMMAFNCVYRFEGDISWLETLKKKIASSESAFGRQKVGRWIEIIESIEDIAKDRLSLIANPAGVEDLPKLVLDIQNNNIGRYQGEIKNYKTDDLQYYVAKRLEELGQEYYRLKDLLGFIEQQLQARLIEWRLIDVPAYKEGKILLGKAGKGYILFSKQILSNPIAIFHEVMHWLEIEGLIDISIREGRQVEVRKTKDRSLLFSSQIDSDLIPEKWLLLAGKLGSSHYKLRILQRLIFKDKDVFLTAEIRVLESIERLKEQGYRLVAIKRAFERMGSSYFPYKVEEDISVSKDEVFSVLEELRGEFSDRELGFLQRYSKGIILTPKEVLDGWKLKGGQRLDRSYQPGGFLFSSVRIEK